MEASGGDVQSRVENLEKSMAVAEATQAAAQAGMAAAVVAGAAGFVGGMLVALLFALVARP